MKKIYLAIFLLTGTILAKAQQVDSIFFHLYTDSLKKGTYNYINVDGKTRSGQWLPLTAREINFSANAGQFEGNSLFIDKNLSQDRVMIKAVLKADTTIARTCVIYIKRTEDPELPKMPEEILNRRRRTHNR